MQKLYTKNGRKYEVATDGQILTMARLAVIRSAREAPVYFNDPLIAANFFTIQLAGLQHEVFGVAFLDADRDGWQDAFVANGHIDDYIEQFDSQVTYAQRPLFYRNVRGERFQEIGLQAGPALARRMVARGCAVADYDRDGDPDLIVTENNGPAHLFRNDTPTPNRHLRVLLRGKAPNREAIGARVTVTAGGVQQVRWVRAGGHYYSQSELALTFGLGPAATADVAVTWPRGSASESAGVATGTTITLTEP